MDWLNLHISTIDSPEATLCDPVRRATWIWLLRFCIGQENGGRIEGCGAWGDTTWQQMAKVRLREVRAKSTLWHWDGDALVVNFYPSEKEAEVQAKRTGGAYGGKAATEAKAQAARSNGARGGRPKTQGQTQAPETQEPKLNPTEGNGKERNGMERKSEAVPPPAREQTHPPPPPSDPMFDGEAPPAQIAQAQRAKNLGDFQSMHGRIHVGRDERDAWQAMINLWTYEACVRAYQAIVPTLTDSKHRVLLSMMTKWLDDHLELTPEDLARANR